MDSINSLLNEPVLNKRKHFRGAVIDKKGNIHVCNPITCDILIQ